MERRKAAGKKLSIGLTGKTNDLHHPRNERSAHLLADRMAGRMVGLGREIEGGGGMINIYDQLRVAAAWARQANEPDNSSMLDDAADIIEALTVERDALKAEVAILRLGLRIAKNDLEDIDEGALFPFEAIDGVMDCLEQADRAALEAKGE